MPALGLVVVTPNMVMRKRSAVIDKRFAIELYCYAREAERSVHFATRGSDQWTLFREYYSSEKMEAVNRVVQELKGLIPLDPPIVYRQHFGHGGQSSGRRRASRLHISQTRRNRHGHFIEMN